MIARLALGWSLLLISQGTPSPLTAPELAAQLDGLASVIEAADATAAASVLPSVPVSEVVTAAGATYEIKFDWLRGGLREAGAGGPYWLSRRAALASRLRAMAHEARAAGADQGHPAGARQALTEVLTQKRFQRARTRSWMADLRRRFGQWLSDLWERTVGRTVARRDVARFVAWAASLAAVLVLLIWVARLLSRRRADRPMTVGPLDVGRTPWYIFEREAASLIEAGRIREAARAAYRAAVHRLEHEGALHVDEARTPREYLRLLPPGHRRQAALSALTLTFERIWYGSRAAAPDEGDRILALLQDLGCLSGYRAK